MFAIIQHEHLILLRLRAAMFVGGTTATPNGEKTYVDLHNWMFF